MALMPSFNSSVGSKSSGRNLHRKSIYDFSENGSKVLQSSWIRRLKPPPPPQPPRPRPRPQGTDKPPVVPENAVESASAVAEADVLSACTNSSAPVGSGAVLGHRNTISTDESRTRTSISNFRSASDLLFGFRRVESQRDCFASGFGPFRVRTWNLSNNPNTGPSCSTPWVRLPERIVRVSQEPRVGTCEVDVKPDLDNVEAERFGFLDQDLDVPDHESYREFYGDFPFLQRIVHCGEEGRKSGFQSYGGGGARRNSAPIEDKLFENDVLIRGNGNFMDEGVVSSSFHERRMEQGDHGGSVIRSSPATNTVARLSPLFQSRKLLMKQDCTKKQLFENVNSDVVATKTVTRLLPFSQTQELLLKRDCVRKKRVVNVNSDVDWSEPGKFVKEFGRSERSQKALRIQMGESTESFGRLEGSLPYGPPSFNNIGNSIDESLNVGNPNKFAAIPDDDSKNPEPSGINRDGFPSVMFNGHFEPETSAFLRSTKSDYLLPMGERKFMDSELNSHNLDHPWPEKTKLHVLGNENKCVPSSRTPTVARDSQFDVPGWRQYGEQLYVDPWHASTHEIKCFSRSKGAADHDKLEGTAACRTFWDAHPVMHHNMVSRKHEGQSLARPGEENGVFSMWSNLERLQRVKNVPSVFPAFSVNKNSRKRSTEGDDFVPTKSRKLVAENY